MSARRPLLAIGPSRPLQYRLIRINGVRYRSQINLADRQRADEKGSNTPPQDPTGPRPRNPSPDNEPTPFNSPKTGRSRQQRAAQVSEEVQMLSRDNNVSKTYGSNSPYPRVRSTGVDAEEAGHVSGGRMGANMSLEREGPNAQGAGRPIRAGFGSPESRTERGTGGRIVDPENGGMGLVETSRNRQGRQSVDEQVEEDEEDEDSDDGAYSTVAELQLLEQYDKQEVTAVPFEPEAVTREEFLQLGQGGATIAGNNLEGVVADRLKFLAEQTQDRFRYAPAIAKRMMKGEFVSFKDEEEKTAVIAAAEKYAQYNADKISEQKDGAEVEKFEHEFASVSEQTQNVVFDKLVRGKYGDLKATLHKQDVLNHIAKSTLRNSSYLEADGSRLLKKVASLLPAQTAARPAGRAASKKK